MKPDPLRVKMLARLPHKYLSYPDAERVLILHGMTRFDGSSTITGFEKGINTHPDPANHYRVRWSTKDDRIIGLLHTHPAHDGRLLPSDDDRAKLPWWMLGAVYRDREVVWFNSTAMHPQKTGMLYNPPF